MPLPDGGKNLLPGFAHDGQPQHQSLPDGVLCELTNPDGTMAKLPQVIDFAGRRDIHVLAVEDIIAYRRAHIQKAV